MVAYAPGEVVAPSSEIGRHGTGAWHVPLNIAVVQVGGVALAIGLFRIPAVSVATCGQMAGLLRTGDEASMQALRWQSRGGLCVPLSGYAGL